jgi:hypothetical protein
MQLLMIEKVFVGPKICIPKILNKAQKLGCYNGQIKVCFGESMKGQKCSIDIRFAL